MEDSVRIALLNILQTTLLDIRMHGWARDAERCAIEADHVHNIPSLLRGELRRELVEYYWRVERVAYLEQIGGVTSGQFDAGWATINAYLQHSGAANS